MEETSAGPEPELRRIGANLRAAREAKGLSQPQFAARIGRHKNSVSLWENGQQEMGVLDAIRATVILDTTLHALLIGEAVAAPPRLRRESLFFISPAMLARVRAATTLDELLKQRLNWPPVGVELHPEDYQVSADEYAAMQAEAEAIYAKLEKGPIARFLQRFRQRGR